MPNVSRIWGGGNDSKSTPVRTSAAAAAAKSLQSCRTLCDPVAGSPPGSSVPGILQARTLECVAISFSSAWKWKVKVKSLSCVQLFVTPWAAVHKAPPSMGVSRQGKSKVHRAGHRRQQTGTFRSRLKLPSICEFFFLLSRQLQIAFNSANWI